MRPEGHRRLAVLIFEKTYRATLDALMRAHPDTVSRDDDDWKGRADG